MQGSVQMAYTIKIFVLLLAFGLPVRDGTVHDTVDLIEVNTVYDQDDGFPRFTQLIFWDWHDIDRKFHVVAWTMYDNIWVEDEEHEKKWMKALMDHCVKTGENFQNLTHRYRGKYDPVPGMTFPQKEKDGYYHIVVYKTYKRFDIKAKIIRETNTMYDPEVEDRREYKDHKRRGIFGAEPLATVEQPEGTLR